LISGKSPFIGGRDHTTHHMVYKGFSERQTAIVFSAVSIICSATGVVVLFTFSNLNLYYFMLILGIILSMSFSIYSLTIKKGNKVTEFTGSRK
jgi:UDP-GlcNAc:undecaprenyl-phosphate GlcNAc-1-phosphate transferase